MATNRNSVYDTNLAVAFLWPFKTAVWSIFIYALLGCGAMMLGLIFAQYFWHDPIQSSDLFYQAEVARAQALSASGTRHLLGLTEFTQRWTYWLFFQATTLHDAMYAHFNHEQVNQVDQLYLSQFVARNSREIYISMNVIQVYGIRAGMLIAAIPLFILVYFIATVDGLTERYIRRACAGRESADMNKIGRMGKLLFFAGGITFYLCTPISMNPYWIIGPMALAFAVGTRIQWQFYKKYL